MFSRRIVAARPLAHAVAPAFARRPQFIQQVRTALTEAEHAELADPNMVISLLRKKGTWV
jgi:NADH dehydrogenase (ubiquinone) 1 beta subcomplex subunit 8